MFQVQYQRFEVINTAERGWNIPLLSDFLQSQKLEDIFNNAPTFDSLTVGDFLRSVLGSSQEKPEETVSVAPSLVQKDTEDSTREIQKDMDNISGMQKVQKSDIEERLDDKPSNDEFLRFFQKGISETLGINLDGPTFPSLDSVNWDALDVIKNLGLASQNKANSQYVESGLAIATTEKNVSSVEVSDTENAALSTEELKKVTKSLLKQTEETLKTWTVLSASLTRDKSEPIETATNKEIIAFANKRIALYQGFMSVLSCLHILILDCVFFIRLRFSRSPFYKPSSPHGDITLGTKKHGLHCSWGHNHLSYRTLSISL